MSESQQLQWVFDGVPPSGARLGGDPSAFVFDASVETFTREVLQNSADQAAGDAPVEVTFTLDELDGARADTFRDALSWRDLESHMAGVRDSAGPTEKRRFDRTAEGDRTLRVLWVEDRNTTGLDGPESGGGTFAALCRDRLFSHKQRGGSGGSFGLGKAVLWRFSEWSTVIFQSRPKGRDISRFIAKAALPWHRVGEHEFAGDGWLGKPERVDAGQRAVSIWSPASDAVGVRLGLPEWTDGSTGTRIGVVGFHDPAGDEGAGAPLSERIEAAAERNFWPAMTMDRLRVEVRPSSHQHPPTPWRELWESYQACEECETLSDEGDIVMVPISVQLPGRKGREAAFVAVLDLVVRLSSVETPGAFELAAFRGAGMIVERRRRERLSASARPFHAILVGGMARRDAAETDALVEEFLRDAEPPSHDRWVSTPRLKQQWKRGYAKAVREIWQRAEEQLRRVVSTPIDHEDDGPDGLRRLFPLSGEGGGRSESTFRFRDLSAELVEGRWRFAGTVEPSEPTKEAWQVLVTARVPDEKGTTIPVEAISAESGEAEVERERGRIRASAGQASVTFTGRTTDEFLVDPRRSSFELVVTGGEVES